MKSQTSGNRLADALFCAGRAGRIPRTSGANPHSRLRHAEPQAREISDNKSDGEYKRTSSSSRVLVLAGGLEFGFIRYIEKEVRYSVAANARLFCFSPLTYGWCSLGMCVSDIRFTRVVKMKESTVMGKTFLQQLHLDGVGRLSVQHPKPSGIRQSRRPGGAWLERSFRAFDLRLRLRHARPSGSQPGAR